MTETRSTQTQMFVSRLSGASACGMGDSSPRGRETREQRSPHGAPSLFKLAKHPDP
jgi:hypothetical protein